jgi:putative transposase
MDATDNERGEAQYYECCVVELYNSCRPHRSLDLAPPNGRPAIENRTGSQPLAVKRRDRLGGLIREYKRAA